jgi:NAD-dependent deacetylase sirtuin 5
MFFIIIWCVFFYFRLVDINNENLSIDDLPKCKKNECNGLLRPNVVWFEETLDPKNVAKIEDELDNCDYFLIVS